MAFSACHATVVAAVALLLAGSLVPPVRGDFAADRAECQDQLTGLAVCLPYAAGTAKMPTPDCCSGLRQTAAKSLKCLCLLIKDRNEPGLGFTFNATLALGLPTVCHANADIHDCPKLLNLMPHSKDALVFEQYNNSSGGGSSGNSKEKSTPGGNGGTAVRGASASSGSRVEGAGTFHLLHLLNLASFIAFYVMAAPLFC